MHELSINSWSVWSAPAVQHGNVQVNTTTGVLQVNTVGGNVQTEPP